MGMEMYSIPLVTPFQKLVGLRGFGPTLVLRQCSSQVWGRLQSSLEPQAMGPLHRQDP